MRHVAAPVATTGLVFSVPVTKFPDGGGDIRLDDAPPRRIRQMRR